MGGDSELMWLTLLARYWKPLAALVLCAAALFWAYSKGVSHEAARNKATLMDARLKALTEELRLTEQARKSEKRAADAMERISGAYEQGKRDAEAKSVAVVADLRAGNLKLRDHWRGCQRDAEAATSAAVADAEARVREEAAGRIVRVGAEADAQVRGLQSVVADYRRQMDEWAK